MTDRAVLARSPARRRSLAPRSSAGCGAQRRTRRRRAASGWSRPRTSGAASPASSAGPKADVQSIIVNPAQDPHSYEPTAADARTMATAQLAIVNGVGYDPWAPKLLAADPDGGRLVADRRRACSDSTRATTRTAGTTRPTSSGGRRDHGRPEAPRPQRRRLLRAPAAHVRDHGPCALPRADRADQRRYAGVPVGASESIFALQAPALGLRPDHALQLHEGDQRGHRGQRPGHVDHRAPDHAPPDQGVGLQLPERDPGDPAAERARPRSTASRSRRSPRRCRPATRQLRAVAGRPARGDRAAPCTRRPDDDRAAAAAGDCGRRPRPPSSCTERVGPARRQPVLSDVDADVGAGEFVAVLGPNGAGKSTLMQAILGLVPLAAGTVTRARRAARAGARRDRLPAPAPELRRLDADPRRRPRPARARRRPLGRAARAHPPAPRAPARPSARRVDEVIELVGAAAYADRARSASSPAASSSGC